MSVPEVESGGSLAGLRIGIARASASSGSRGDGQGATLAQVPRDQLEASKKVQTQSPNFGSRYPGQDLIQILAPDSGDLLRTKADLTEWVYEQGDSLLAPTSERTPRRSPGTRASDENRSSANSLFEHERELSFAPGRRMPKCPAISSASSFRSRCEEAVVLARTPIPKSAFAKQIPAIISSEYLNPILVGVPRPVGDYECFLLASNPRQVEAPCGSGARVVWHDRHLVRPANDAAAPGIHLSRRASPVLPTA